MPSILTRPSGGGGAGGGSISIALSDSTPDYGDDVTITATPTGFTGVITYTFYVRSSIGQWQRIDQASNAYVWAASYAGTYDLCVSAMDTDGNSGTDSVSITVGTLEAKYGFDAAYKNQVELVDDKVNVWNDITGNGYDATAPSATTRCYTSKWGGSSECVSVYATDDDRLETALSMQTDEVTICGVFDYNDNAVQGGFDSLYMFGSGNASSTRYQAVVVDDTVSPRFLNCSVRTSVNVFAVTSTISNGKQVFVMKYSSGTNRAIINGTTASISVTGTLSGGALNYVLLNAAAPNYSLPFPFPVHYLAIKQTAISDAEQDQLYQDLLTMYPA